MAKNGNFMAADLFCGAGGTSTGMVQAARRRGLALDLVAVNHWQTAVDTHTANHPWARHVCADLASVEADPSKLVPGGSLDLLVASPECTHHSIARGGKPCSDQSRASAWHVLHWCERLNVQEVLVENVREFAEWGPLLAKAITYKGKRHKKGRPDPRRKGDTFNAWRAALESLGYKVEWRVINAADYGSATDRKRLFVRASRSGAIVWPHATHAKNTEGLLRWKASREVIDWTLKSQSIFRRKRPLRPKTLDRIEDGLRKFGGEAFIAVLRGTNERHKGSWSSSLDDPLGTITAGGMHAALCQPFVIGQQSGASPRSTDDPLPTVATAGAIALCQPFLVEYHSEKSDKDKRRVKSVDEPLPVQTTENRFGLCQPFVIPMEHNQRGALRSVDETLPTVTTAKGGAFGLCQPFLAKYYGTGTCIPVSEPLDTVTAHDRFALVQLQGMDILFRMLQPHELAAAMGFKGYEFSGNKGEQVRQIGNAVAVEPAEALCGSVMDAIWSA